MLNPPPPHSHTHTYTHIGALCVAALPLAGQPWPPGASSQGRLQHALNCVVLCTHRERIQPPEYTTPVERGSQSSDAVSKAVFRVGVSPALYCSVVHVLGSESELRTTCAMLCHAVLCCAGLVLQLYRWLVSHDRLVPREQGFLRLQQGRMVGYKARARGDILAKK